MTRPENIVMGLVQIVEGLVTVLTLGFATPDWTFKFVVSRYSKKAKR